MNTMPGLSPASSFIFSYAALRKEKCVFQLAVWGNMHATSQVAIRAARRGVMQQKATGTAPLPTSPIKLVSGAGSSTPSSTCTKLYAPVVVHALV
jgi:hypothetical protein